MALGIELRSAICKASALLLSQTPDRQFGDGHVRRVSTRVLSVCPFNFFGDGGAHLMVFKVYFWLYAQGSLLVGWEYRDYM